MIAFHGDWDIKARYLARVKAHRAADELIQGTGWEGGKGCAVGCTLDAYNHRLYPLELGIPENLARLEDIIFEHLRNSEAMMWPTKFLTAIPVGADLSMTWPRFAVWLLHGLSQKGCTPQTLASINKVVMLYVRKIGGDEPSKAEWDRSINKAFLESVGGRNAAASAISAIHANSDPAWVSNCVYAGGWCATQAGTPNVTYWKSCTTELLRLLQLR